MLHCNFKFSFKKDKINFRFIGTLSIVSRWGWFGSSIVFLIGESVCYWLEKRNSMDT